MHVVFDASNRVIYFLLGPASITRPCSSPLATWLQCWLIVNFDVVLESGAAWVPGGNWKMLIRDDFFTDRCQVSPSKRNNWSSFYDFSVLSLLY